MNSREKIYNRNSISNVKDNLKGLIKLHGVKVGVGQKNIEQVLENLCSKIYKFSEIKLSIQIKQQI